MNAPSPSVLLAAGATDPPALLQQNQHGPDGARVGNRPLAEFPLQTAVLRELTLYGSCASRGEYPACLDMMARGAIDVAPLVSAVAPLAEGAGWFRRLYAKEPGLMKVILTP